MSEERLLGGRRALLGFFYQLMGSAGITVLQTTLRDPPLSGELSAVVSFTANQRREFRLEEAGQDLTIVAGEQRLLLQFKYAEEPKTSEIGLPEIRELLRSFAYSLIDLRGQGVNPERITRCVLVTNRSPGTALEQFLSRGSECRARLGVVSERWDRLPADTLPYEGLASEFRIPGKRRHEGTLRQWVEQEIIAGTPESAPQSQKGKRQRPDDSSDKQGLTKAVLWVLPRFVALTKIAPRTLEIPFERFCQEHGADVHETTRAKDHLIGRLFSNAPNAALLRQEEFTEALGLRPMARRLLPEEIGRECAAQGRRWVTLQGARGEGTILRHDLRKIREELESEDARIIVLYGGGGCGKTELLTQAAEPLLEALEQDRFEGFVAMVRASQLNERWLGQLIGGWAQRDPIDDPILRLRRANRPPEGRRLVCIGVDGIDEALPAPLAFRQLVDLARSSRDVQLLLTCRKDEYGEIRRRFLTENATGSLDIGDPDDCKTIEVTDFAEEELMEAVEAALGPSARARIEAARTREMPAELRSSITEPADPMVVDSLTHPRMLGAFAAVHKENPGVTEAALNADPQALAQVARRYLKQFFFKYGHRSEEGYRPRSQDCAEIFRRLAQLSLPIEQKLTLNLHWHSYAAQEGASRSEARQLFDEAESGGLIEVWRGVSEDREWAWRHPFVAEYLAVTDPEEHYR